MCDMEILPKIESAPPTPITTQNPKTHKLTARCPQDLSIALDLFCQERDLVRADVIRKAVKTHMDTQRYKEKMLNGICGS